MSTTKSAITVATRALTVANQTLRPFTHRFSPQLFACLVLKVFLKTDYRGNVAHLRDTATHLVLGVQVSRGSHPDVDRFVGLVDETIEVCQPERVVADAGYDSEPNHRYGRGRGIKTFMPAKHGRPSRQLPTGQYRRQMKQRLNKKHGGYGQRWQVETVNSMLKRRLATAVAGRSFQAQRRDAWLLVLTFNLMLDRPE